MSLKYCVLLMYYKEIKNYNTKDYNALEDKFHDQIM